LVVEKWKKKGRDPGNDQKKERQTKLTANNEKKKIAVSFQESMKDYGTSKQKMIVRRHGGARRILSLELLGFMNLLSPASLYSRVNR